MMLYILGPSYSGSTLLTFLLAAHPDIATIGELKASALGDIETYHCSCGALLKECTFWKDVKAAMEHRGRQFTLDAFGTHFNSGPAGFRRLVRVGVKHPLLALISSMILKQVPSYRSRLLKILEQNRAMTEAVTQIQRGRIFLDGSKDPERLNQFLSNYRWNVKVVRLLRDGRGVTNSYMKHYRVGMRAAVAEWMAVERSCDRVLSRLKASDLLTIKYEDICKQPEESQRPILALVGLTPISTSDFAPRAELHILGNNMRMSLNKPAAPDEKWRKELTGDDLELFESVGGKMNRCHSYL